MISDSAFRTDRCYRRRSGSYAANQANVNGLTWQRPPGADELQRLSLIYFDIPVLRPGTAGAYAFAFIAAAIAMALRLAIDPYVEGVQYVTFFPAVIITTLVSGLGAGLFCLALSVGAVAFFLLPPRFSLHIENVSDVLNTLLFILMTFSNVILIAGMRFGIERYQELSQKLEQHEMALHEREERLALVAAELQHRTRNLISVVGTIADDTLRTSNTFDDFRTSYHDRLEVLGRAQGLLFQKADGGRVTFDELLNSELAAQSVRVREHGSITLNGPQDVRLRSGAVQMLAMALHELVTNAVKYGALKQPSGRLTVRWWKETSAENDRPWLHVDWKESGVEMPPPDARFGHGRELIERALPYQFGAQTTFALEPDGVHCTISLPASEHEL
jgi:two-component sensor histidine kinase